MENPEVVHRLTLPQLRRIWASARALGWDDLRLHQELERTMGTASLRDLSRREAGLFIDHLIFQGAPSTPRDRGTKESGGRHESLPSNVIQLMTAPQRQYIEGMLRDLGWTWREPYFLAVLKRARGHTTVRTQREASICIFILEKILKRSQGNPASPEPANGEQVTRP